LGQNLDFGDVVERSQRRYWFSGQGEPLADCYIRYENLDADYARVCSHLGLCGEPLPRLRVGRRDTGKPYWEYYTDEMRELIESTFQLEINYFSYRFGE
jgi:hypothetical protein